MRYIKRFTFTNSEKTMSEDLFVEKPEHASRLKWRNDAPPPPPPDPNDNPIVCMRCGERGHVRPECARFRTRMCIHHQNGCCHDGRHCSFAHTRTELRDPLTKRCVRVCLIGEMTQQDLMLPQRDRIGDVVVLGCNRVGLTYMECCGNNGGGGGVDDAFDDGTPAIEEAVNREQGDDGDDCEDDPDNC